MADLCEEVKKPEGLDYWRPLSEKEKAVIQDPQDCIIFEIIYGIDEELLPEITAGLTSKSEYFKEYIKEQMGWIKFLNDCYEKRNGITQHPDEKDFSPEADKIRNDEYRECRNTHLPEKYSLYYLARHPEKMKIPPKNPYLSQVLAEFLIIKSNSH